MKEETTVASLLTICTLVDKLKTLSLNSTVRVDELASAFEYVEKICIYAQDPAIISSSVTRDYIAKAKDLLTVIEGLPVKNIVSSPGPTASQVAGVVVGTVAIGLGVLWLRNKWLS